MLAKCTNFSCSASFSHLDEGRLFLLETDPIFGSSKAKTTEYFWLCKACSADMTLRLTPGERLWQVDCQKHLLVTLKSHSSR
jgi:hypothetical protein